MLLIRLFETFKVFSSKFVIRLLTSTILLLLRSRDVRDEGKRPSPSFPLNELLDRLSSRRFLNP